MSKKKKYKRTDIRGSTVLRSILRAIKKNHKVLSKTKKFPVWRPEHLEIIKNE